MGNAGACNSLRVGGDGDRLRLPDMIRFSVSDLSQVSATKTKLGAKTVLHLCGNKWCCSSGHYFVGSKVFNDEQTSCHKGLHNAVSLEEYLQIQACYCKHEPKCWAMPCRDKLDLTPSFCETGMPEEVDLTLSGEGVSNSQGSSDEFGSDSGWRKRFWHPISKHVIP